MLREYDDIESVILSGQFLLYPSQLSVLNINPLVSVGEDEEVSIKEVTDAIVKAVGFQGEYTVCLFYLLFIYIFHQQFKMISYDSSTPHVQMVNSVNLLRTKSYCL